MGLGWIKDFKKYDIKSLLLLEEKQIEWINFNYSRSSWIKVLQEYPYIAWYFINKCPLQKQNILDLLKENSDIDIATAETTCLQMIEDWLVFVTNPSLYDSLEFLTWDESELTSLTDFNNKVIVDIGSGTGKQAFAVKNATNTVLCVEPVGNLRKYLKEKARSKNLTNFYVVDGLIEAIPLPDEFADITMGGHVFGEYLDEEYNELLRVTKKNGMIILIPGNNDVDNEVHQFLMSKNFSFGRFLEPNDGMKRKYWKIK